jgi:hypothetical protein
MTTTASTSKNGTTSASAASPMEIAANEVRGALAGMSKSVPDMARASRAAVDDLFSSIESGSDERLSVGLTLSLGLAIGLLVGGAPRLLIAIALAPLAAMGFVLADRRASSAKARPTSA